MPIAACLPDPRGYIIHAPLLTTTRTRQLEEGVERIRAHIEKEVAVSVALNPVLQRANVSQLSLGDALSSVAFTRKDVVVYMRAEYVLFPEQLLHSRPIPEVCIDACRAKREIVKKRRLLVSILCDAGYFQPCGE